MVTFLTSKLDLYDKLEDDTRIPHHFGNVNGILDNIKKYVKKYDKFLIVASVEDNPEMTDMYAESTIASFNMTLPFAEYNILDGRTMDRAESLVKEADFIFLCGGHVPTQNAFMTKINLRELLTKSQAVVLGCSAGSMNSADIVYSPPELEGESLDPNFVRFFPGLNRTQINIYPHFDKLKDEWLDGKRMTEDIALPDSYNIDIIALNDGAYILQLEDKAIIYGKAFLMKNGEIISICEDNQTREI